ncbi:hypothetical protein KCU71_g164, partial [Aureobasidium melanogenum]
MCGEGLTRFRLSTTRTDRMYSRYMRDVSSEVSDVKNTFSGWDHRCFHSNYSTVADSLLPQVASNHRHHRRSGDSHFHRVVSGAMSLLRRRVLLQLHVVFLLLHLVLSHNTPNTNLPLPPSTAPNNHNTLILTLPPPTNPLMKTLSLPCPAGVKAALCANKTQMWRWAACTTKQPNPCFPSLHTPKSTNAPTKPMQVPMAATLVPRTRRMRLKLNSMATVITALELLRRAMRLVLLGLRRRVTIPLLLGLRESLLVRWSFFVLFSIHSNYVGSE